MSIVLKLKPSNAANLKMVPPAGERKKVSFEGDYIKVPRELLRAVHRARFTEVEADVFWAIYEKVIGWHKETDRIVNEQICELSERELTKSNINMIGEAKKRLVNRKILLVEGKKIGVNLAVSEWVNPTQTGKKSIPVKVGKFSQSNLVSNPTLTGNTKDNIKRNKINNKPPVVPHCEMAVGCGEKSAEADAPVLAENLSPVEPAMVETQTTGENTPLAEPAMADKPAAVKKPAAKMPVDYLGVLAAFNAAVADTPIASVRLLNDKRKRAIHSLAKVLNREFKTYEVQAFQDYFEDFVKQAKAKADQFYFGGKDGSSWVANFEYVLREATFTKTFEGGL